MSAPRKANSRAVAAPMPLLPPVIRQTFPSSFIQSSFLRSRSSPAGLMLVRPYEGFARDHASWNIRVVVPIDAVGDRRRSAATPDT